MNDTVKRHRAKQPTANAKTVLCKSFISNGDCRYGEKCTFAHGPEELQRVCWFFNNGGCSKSADECSRRHVVMKNVRKPTRRPNKRKFEGFKPEDFPSLGGIELKMVAPSMNAEADVFIPSRPLNPLAPAFIPC